MKEVLGPEAVVALDRRHVWHPFTQEHNAPDPIPIVSGMGAELEAADGRRFLDLISSWWVNLHGHGNPEIAEAIAGQAKRLEQVIFAGFTHQPAATLAAALTESLPGDLDRVFFSDDGSTAVEVALKLSWQYWVNQGRARSRFLAFEGGYHGDTVGAMSVGRSSGFFDIFDGLTFRVDTLPFPATWANDPEVESKERESLAALDRYLSRYGHNTAAMILEPLVQGAGGMRMCRPEFVRELVARLRQSGVLAIFDEVMTGFGRTGELFACHVCGVTPDIICLSKGLTGGFLPMAVTVCRESLYRAFLDDSFDRAFAHGHSYTANPLGCAAAVASLGLLRTGSAMEDVRRIRAEHEQFLSRLSSLPRVARPRGTGTILAFELDAGESGYNAAIGQRLKAAFFKRGLLIRPLGPVVYLMPPYCIASDQLERAYRGICEVIEEVA